VRYAPVLLLIIRSAKLCRAGPRREDHEVRLEYQCRLWWLNCKIIGAQDTSRTLLPGSLACWYGRLVGNLIASRPAIAVRSKIRQYPGLQGVMVRLLAGVHSENSYEENFRKAMFACIRPGDCVWDVGANIGLYSELFAEAVGPTGAVVSFEPSPDCVSALEARRQGSSAHASWQVVAGALADTDGQAWLSVADGSMAPGNHLADHPENSTIQVRKFRADSLLAAGYSSPSVIKIDVEGFEGEVLDGMGALLAGQSLKAICVEVHFRALSERGKPAEPARMVRLLKDLNFSLTWTDRSHFVARRRGE
jgi:FkbM family methyltransferase